MKLTIDQIYQAKAERRKALAALPLEEKARLIEKLRDMGLALRAARTQNRVRLQK